MGIFNVFADISAKSTTDDIEKRYSLVGADSLFVQIDTGIDTRNLKARIETSYRSTTGTFPSIIRSYNQFHDLYWTVSFDKEEGGYRDKYVLYPNEVSQPTDFDFNNYCYIAYYNTIQFYDISQDFNLTIDVKDSNCENMSCIQYVVSTRPGPMGYASNGDFNEYTKASIPTDGNKNTFFIGINTDRGSTEQDHLSKINYLAILRYPLDEAIELSAQNINLNPIWDISFNCTDEDSHVTPDLNDSATWSGSVGGIKYVPYSYPNGRTYRCSPGYGNMSTSSYPKEFLLQHSTDISDTCEINGYYDANPFRTSLGYYQKMGLSIDSFYWNIGEKDPVSGKNTYVRMTADDFYITGAYPQDGSDYSPVYDWAYSCINPNTGEWISLEENNEEQIKGTFNIYSIESADWKSNLIKSYPVYSIAKHSYEQNRFIINYREDTQAAFDETKLEFTKEDRVTGIYLESPVYDAARISGFLTVKYNININSENLKSYLMDPDRNNEDLNIVTIGSLRHFSGQIQDNLTEDLHLTENKNEYWSGSLDGFNEMGNRYTDTEFDSNKVFCRDLIDSIYAYDSNQFVKFYNNYESGGMVRGLSSLSFESLYYQTQFRLYESNSVLSKTDPSRYIYLYKGKESRINPIEDAENGFVLDSFSLEFYQGICLPNTEEYIEMVNDPEFKINHPDIHEQTKIENGKIYLLLPQGFYIDSVIDWTNAYAYTNPYKHMNGEVYSPDSLSCDTINNFKGTGCQLVTITFSADENLGTPTLTGYDYPPSSWYGSALNLFCIIKKDVNDFLYSNPTVNYIYGVCQILDNEGNVRTAPRLSSYTNTQSDKGYSTNATIFKNLKYQNTGTDEDYVFYDIDGDGLITEKSTYYGYDDFTYTYAGVVTAGIDLNIEGISNKYNTFDRIKLSTNTEPYNYSYRIAVKNSSGHVVRNVVLYNILESSVPGDKIGWKGTFDSVDTTYAESLGIQPVIYYSTVQGLTYPTYSSMTDLDTWYQDTSIWSTEMPADKSTITAIAVDLTTKTDGTTIYSLPENSVVYAIINMTAPDTDPRIADPDAEFAYNKAAFSAYTDIIGGSNRYQLLTGSTVRVGLNSVDIQASKIWDNASNWWGDQPQNVQIKLLANGAQAEGTTIQTLNETNSWSYTFERMPVFTDSGSEITYTIEEVSVPDGYLVSYTHDTMIETDPDTGDETEVDDPYSFIMTNTHTNDGNDIYFAKFSTDDRTEINPLSGAVFDMQYWAPGSDITGTADETSTYTSATYDLQSLSDGYYTLTEQTPVPNYGIVPPISFTIRNGIITLDEPTRTDAVTSTYDSKLMLSIFDTPLAELSSTGGNGVGDFTIYGLAMMIMSSMIVYYKRRKKT